MIDRCLWAVAKWTTLIRSLIFSFSWLWWELFRVLVLVNEGQQRDVHDSHPQEKCSPLLVTRDANNLIFHCYWRFCSVKCLLLSSMRAGLVINFNLCWFCLYCASRSKSNTWVYFHLFNALLKKYIFTMSVSSVIHRQFLT